MRGKANEGRENRSIVQLERASLKSVVRRSLTGQKNGGLTRCERHSEALGCHQVGPCCCSARATLLRHGLWRPVARSLVEG